MLNSRPGLAANMVVTTTRLNSLFLTALKKSYSNKNAASVMGMRSVSMDVDRNEASVMGLRGGIYVFSIGKLEAESVALLSVLKQLPKEIRQSVSPDGIPWIMVRSTRSVLSDADDETIERFLLMCMALGFVRSVDSPIVSCPIPFVTMDDIALVRKEKIKRGKKRAILIRWFA